METRANYALIGLFTLAVLAAAFGFVFWFSGRDAAGKRDPYRVVFTGPVSGLNSGSLVLFNGLRVGEVKSIALDRSDPRRVIATVEVERSTPIKQDTKARLEYQGLTGVASIALVGGDAASPDLDPKPDDPAPIITADQSGFQDLMETARGVAARADNVLAKVEALVDQNKGSIGDTFNNVNRFSKALGDNADGLGRFLGSVSDAAQKIEVLAGSLDAIVHEVDRAKITRIVANADKLMETLGTSIDQKKVGRILDNADSLMATLGAAGADVQNVVKNAASLTAKLDKSADRVDAVMVSVDDAGQRIQKLAGDADALLQGFDRQKLGRIVDNTDRLMAVLGTAGPDVQAVAKNVASLTGKLDKSADRIDTVLASLGDAGRKVDSLATDVGAIVRNVDAQKINTIVANVDRFAGTLGTSSPEVEKIVRSVASITAKLDKSADLIDGVLKAAEGFMSGPDGKGAFQEVADAARSIRTLANNLDKRTAEITASINRFTGPGLKEYQALASDGRRTLDDINRTLRNVERNPQQFLFGGRAPIPEYNGRR